MRDPSDDRQLNPAESDQPPSRQRWYGARWRRRTPARLPMNSDIEVARNVVGVPVIVQIRPRYLAVAAIGGALGAAARFVLTQSTPIWETLSAGTVVVNIVGPFFLGVLLQALAERTETRRTRALRLLVGVGFLGALTSYAQLAVDVVVVAENTHVLLAAGYAAATLVAGAGAVWLGIFSAKNWHRLVRQRERVDE
ncbi:CrcB family protein [Homoserinimonas sp. OAct 916]|uniref:fluoride efflux transporter FluC n=1 Tax=Homoserinimonas sp. OAct 916 TaxID=2211450 RepID=UPI000DBE4B74|nr:CrcB family protein [Homoserinimonas sp. OAct 916]